MSFLPLFSEKKVTVWSLGQMMSKWSSSEPFLRFAFETDIPIQGLPIQAIPVTLTPLWDLDDWLILAHLRDQLCEHRDLVLKPSGQLGKEDLIYLFIFTVLQHRGRSF